MDEFIGLPVRPAEVVVLIGLLIVSALLLVTWRAVARAELANREIERREQERRGSTSARPERTTPLGIIR